MPRCLFGLKEHIELTEEHVFPAALGGNLVIKNSACSVCNSNCSSFEQPLAEELAPVRLLLKIPDRYGKTPQVEATAKTRDREYAARIKSDGSIQIRPIVTVINGKGGSKEIVYQFMTDRQREKLQREAKEKGFQLLESEAGAGEEAEIHVSGDLRVIGSQEGLRTAAKIGYVGLAYYAGCGFAMGDAFNEVRQYIQAGDCKPSARLFVHEGFLGAVDMGPHQHAIILAGRHDKHRVDAIVRLFGGLAYFVTLSAKYEGADFFNTLVYDAYRGEVNGMLFTNEQAEFLQTEDVATSGETVWDDIAASGQWFVTFLDSRIKAKLNRDRPVAKRSE